jgi:hypothetical protein
MLSPFSAVPLISADDQHETALVAVMTLFVLLLMKEVATSVYGRRARRLDRTVVIGVMPLLLVFVAAASSRLGAVLRLPF